MSKNIFLILVGMLIFFGLIYILTYEKNGDGSLIECLNDSGVVIYGTKTCPACSELADKFGGYEAIESIYVDCAEEWKRCHDEMLSHYVPEVQIDGVLFERAIIMPENIAEEAGCDVNLE